MVPLLAFTAFTPAPISRNNITSSCRRCELRDQKSKLWSRVVKLELKKGTLKRERDYWAGVLERALANLQDQKDDVAAATISLQTRSYFRQILARVDGELKEVARLDELGMEEIREMRRLKEDIEESAHCSWGYGWYEAYLGESWEREIEGPGVRPESSLSRVEDLSLAGTEREVEVEVEVEDAGDEE